jgi:uncharacterized membrane protein
LIDFGWFAYALLGGVCFGLHAILTQLTLTKEFTPMVVNTYFFSLGTVILWVYSALTKETAVPDSRTAVKLLLLALLSVIGFWSLFKGYGLAPNPGYVRAVFSVNVIVAFVLSLLLFDATVNVVSMLGIALVIVGTVLLAFA